MIGSNIVPVALAFAVLDIASATALGIVFAVRQGLVALVVVAGGVTPAIGAGLERLDLSPAATHRFANGLVGALVGVTIALLTDTW